MEGDAGTSQLNPTDEQDVTSQDVVTTEPSAEESIEAHARSSSGLAQMRAAVEKHNDDGSIDVLVAVRVKINNSAEKDKEVGYRMRAQMAPVDGKFKVAKLDQVTS